MYTKPDELKPLEIACVAEISMDMRLCVNIKEVRLDVRAVETAEQARTRLSISPPKVLEMQY